MQLMHIPLHSLPTWSIRDSCDHSMSLYSEWVHFYIQNKQVDVIIFVEMQYIVVIYLTLSVYNLYIAALIVLMPMNFEKICTLNVHGMHACAGNIC